MLYYDLAGIFVDYLKSKISDEAVLTMKILKTLKICSTFEIAFMDNILILR